MAVFRRGCVRREGARKGCAEKGLAQKGFAQEGFAWTDWSSRYSQIRNENRNALPISAQVGAPTSARSPTMDMVATPVTGNRPALLIGGYADSCLLLTAGCRMLFPQAAQENLPLRAGQARGRLPDQFRGRPGTSPVAGAPPEGGRNFSGRLWTWTTSISISPVVVFSFVVFSLAMVSFVAFSSAVSPAAVSPASVFSVPVVSICTVGFPSGTGAAFGIFCARGFCSL